MPHKFNADRRDKIPKQEHRVTNWAEYNEGLRWRGDLTVWISEDVLCLTLGVVFRQPLRQTQGLMRSIAELLGIAIAVPNFSTPSRRGNGLSLSARPTVDDQAAIHLAVDSTGLKNFGEGGWQEEKRKNKAKRKRWRKLHLGLDLVSGEIVCSGLATEDVGDPTALLDPLDQVDGPVDLFLADGAYDGGTTRILLSARFGSMIEIVIPPPKNANFCPNAAQGPTVRDRDIAHIKTHTFENQKTEAKIGVRALNRMTGLGRPNFEHTA